MNRISLNCSSFVGKPTGYHPTNTWENCVDAVNAFYSSPETFPARFKRMLLDVRALGFDALDIWTVGQLSWRWATEEQVAAARRLLAEHKLSVTSIGGEFGATRAEFRAACKLGAGVGAPLLSGTSPLIHFERAYVIATLTEFDLRWGIENHPERNAPEMLAQIGDGGAGRIGTTVDTGWYATQGEDVVRAIHELNEHILHVHLKDVRAGNQDLNVGFGQGIVPLEACVRALKKIGYRGDYSIEIHAFDHDPTDEIRAALGLARKWLKG